MDEAGKAMLRASYAMRAKAYAHMVDVLTERLGEAEASAIGKEGTRRLGEEMGARFAHLGPDDLKGLGEAFLNSIPIREELFAPQVERADGEALVIKFHRCPLKEAWEADGRTGEDLARLCAVAGAIDAGLFTRAGFTFAGTTWRPGETGCCRLVVHRGPPPAA